MSIKIIKSLDDATLQPSGASRSKLIVLGYFLAVKRVSPLFIPAFAYPNDWFKFEENGISVPSEYLVDL